MARHAVYKTLSEESMDVIRWLDRMLIKLVARFAEYKKDEPSSFKLSREFSLFP
jgi:protein transport protein SEC23